MSKEDKPSYPLLDTIASPDDLKALSLEECAVLAEEIRQFIVEAVTTGGSGHLGSNLGAVEITLAMHRVFTSPRDVLLFDTGHQAYVHKLVTGRHAGFALLRREGALGLPEPVRVRARLDRELPRLDGAQLRLRNRQGVQDERRGRDPPGRGPHRRRCADGRAGVRGDEQPRPRRRAGLHHPQRQRPQLRPDGLATFGVADPAAPESELQRGPVPDQAGAGGAARGRHARRTVAPRTHGGGAGDRRAACLFRGARDPLRGADRRTRRRGGRAGAEARRRLAGADRPPRPHDEGEGLRTGRGGHRSVPSRLQVAAADRLARRLD